MKEHVVQLLAQRGVSLDEIADLVLEVHRDDIPGLTLEECRESVERVLGKREAQYAIMTGIALDTIAEQGGLPPGLEEAVFSDSPLFGIDEVLALAITTLYGSAGLIGFGYLDKAKPGVLQRINGGGDGRVHTFLDDLLAAVAAAAGARLIHKHLGSPEGVDNNNENGGAGKDAGGNGP